MRRLWDEGRDRREWIWVGARLSSGLLPYGVLGVLGSYCCIFWVGVGIRKVFRRLVLFYGTL